MAVRLALCAVRPITPGRFPVFISAHFCLRLNQPQGHSAVGRIRSIEKSNYLIGNQTCNLPAFSTLIWTLSSHSKGDHALRVFWNRVVGKIFGPNVAVARRYRIQQIEEHHEVYPSPCRMIKIVKDRYCLLQYVVNWYKICIRIYEEKIPFEER
jgi:hypothetical protein